MKKILLFVFMLILPMTVFARAKTGCDYSVISKLKKYASNINIIYDYRIIDNEAYFDVTINNLVPELYVLDEVSGNRYYFDATNNGELVIKDYKDITKLKYKIYSNDASCVDEILLTQYISLPVYNKFSSDPLCKGIEDYKLCHIFLQTNITYEEFKKQVNNYLSKEEEKPVEEKVTKVTKSTWDKVIDFMLDYGVYIVGVIAIFVAFISVRRSRKNQFDFKL